MEKTLLSIREMELKIKDCPESDIVKLLKETLWGTPEKTQFLHHDTEERLKDTINSYYLSLRKREKLLGTGCLVQRDVKLNDEIVGPAYYIRFFSFDLGTTTQGGERKKEVKSDSRGNSFIRRMMGEFFKKDMLSEELSPCAYYAYVEAENERSMKMTQSMGFNKIRSYSTSIYSRIFPKRDQRVRRAKKEEYSFLKKEIAHQYRDYNLYFDHYVFYKDNYFVIEKEGEIVAGVQANPVHWKMVNMPGLSGKITMKVVPMIPLISRLFNPNKFDFIAMDALFVKPGHENVLEALFETVCVEFGMNVSMIWLDNDTDLFRTIRDLNLGLIQKINSDVSVDVMARFAGEGVDASYFEKKPVYVAAYDMT